MKTSFELVADPRTACRGRVRAAACADPGKVPAIIYGGHNEPRQIVLDHRTC